jgi:hypothetical protein
MTRLNVNDARCEALFASELQRSDAPTPEILATAISHTVRQFGIAGCVSRMAQEFGDHPEAAASRMRWIRQLIDEAFAPVPAGWAVRHWLCSHAAGGPGRGLPPALEGTDGAWVPLGRHRWSIGAVAGAGMGPVRGGGAAARGVHVTGGEAVAAGKRGSGGGAGQAGTSCATAL